MNKYTAPPVGDKLGDSINVNEFLHLPSLSDISLDVSYYQMPLSLFCKKLGINYQTLLLKDKGNIKEIL